MGVKDSPNVLIHELFLSWLYKQDSLVLIHAISQHHMVTWIKTAEHQVVARSERGREAAKRQCDLCE